MFQTDFQYIHLSKVYRNEKNCLRTSSKITVVFAKMNVSNSRGNGPFLNNCSLNGEIYPLVKIPSTLAYASQLIACILSIVIVIATVVLNSLIVLTFWRVSRLRENVSLFLVMVLSLVDAATGIFCYPTLTLSQIYSLMESTECWIYMTLNRSCSDQLVFCLCQFLLLLVLNDTLVLSTLFFIAPKQLSLIFRNFYYSFGCVVQFFHFQLILIRTLYKYSGR